MKKEEFIKKCKESRDSFIFDNVIENAVERLFYVGAISESGRNNNQEVYSLMGLLFQKCADYCLHGSTSESTTRHQRAEARNYSRFIGGRIANRR